MWAVVPAVRAVVPSARAGSGKRTPEKLQSDKFWPKLAQGNTKGKWGKILSTRSVDQNHKSLTKSRDRTKSIWAKFFFLIFRNWYGKEKKILVEKWLIKGGEHDPNPWKPLLLIPNVVGLGPIFTDLSGKRDEHEKHGEVARGNSWQTKRVNSKSC